MSAAAGGRVAAGDALTDAPAAGGGAMTGSDRVAGYDRIAPGALVRTAQAVAAEALRAPFRDVRAHVSDDGRGALAVDVTSPLAVPVLGSHDLPSEPVVVTAHRARATIAERLRAISGRQVARVTVSFTSSVVDVPRRVR